MVSSSSIHSPMDSIQETGPPSRQSLREPANLQPRPLRPQHRHREHVAVAVARHPPPLALRHGRPPRALFAAAPPTKHPRRDV
ncbi:uncharacterized protein TrAtP1_009495 [Trichoderma atroviride]|uniref:uncharacterized protein n=1 Tax=Hypocrea atroviridis TaxID=63577 RepID=UPI0033231BBE|nr:hypothetical protein TrAtP1_009495 [Trichoderma atroviride]